MPRRRESGPNITPASVGVSESTRARGSDGGPSRDQLRLMFAGSPERLIPADTVLFAPDDSADKVYLLERGSVDLYRLTPRGRRLVTRRTNAGELFGVMGLLGQSHHENFAEAVKRSVVRVANVGQVRESLRGNPDLALGLLTMVGARLNESEVRCVDFAYNPVEARVARLLVERADSSNGAVHPLTHREIADTIGAVRQTVSRVLASLERRGLIRREFRSVFVIDRRGLEDVAATER